VTPAAHRSVLQRGCGWLAALLLCGAMATAQAQGMTPSSVFPGVPFVAAAPLLSQPEITFPREAGARGVGGSVVIAFLVGTDGAPEKHRIVESDPPLIFDAAINAVAAEFRFAPAVRDGKPSRYETRVALAFAPRKPAANAPE
jgi:protein TonB